MASLILGLVVQSIILSWVNKLERKCECSADWRRDYIKYFTIAMIIYGVAGALAPKQILNMPLVAIVGLASIVNLGSILSYIPNLKKKGCDCATENDWRDNFIFWWSLLSVILVVVGSGAVAFISVRK